jgi:hypothetical protein
MAEGQEAVDFHQETHNLASRPFTFEAKVQRLSLFQSVYMAIFFDQGDGLLKEVWSDKIENTNYG